VDSPVRFTGSTTPALPVVLAPAIAKAWATGCKRSKPTSSPPSTPPHRRARQSFPRSVDTDSEADSDTDSSFSEALEVLSAAVERAPTSWTPDPALLRDGAPERQPQDDPDSTNGPRR
jgi:hypothetical protein